MLTDAHTQALSRLTSIKTMVLVMLFAFFASFDYALSRSQIESLYNVVWHSRGELLWLATAVILFLVVSIYNYFAVRKNLWLIGLIAICISSVLLFLLARNLPVIILKKEKYSFFEKMITFLLALWKDVYVIILIEVFWTFVSVVNKIRSARSLYGVFAFIGSFGDFVGNFCAKQIPPSWKDSFLGPYPTVLLVLPFLLITGVFAFLLYRSVGEYQSIFQDKKEQPTFIEGLKVVRKSPYLLYILITIAIFQIVTGFIQKQLDLLLNTNFSVAKQDSLRNNIYLWISMSSIVLSFINSLLFRFVKVQWPLFGIPLVIGGLALSFSVSSTLGFLPLAFQFVAMAYIASKCFNYSVFRSAKELLYVPLTYVEKVQGKGLIDMFVYRFGKAFAGLLLLPIHLFHGNAYLGWFSVSLVGIWITITIPLLKNYYERVRSQIIQEEKPGMMIPEKVENNQ